MGKIEVDPRGSQTQHDEKDRQENEEPLDMPSLTKPLAFVFTHIYSLRKNEIYVNIKKAHDGMNNAAVAW